MNNTLQPFSDICILDGKVTSLNIAKHFEKEHKNVLRDVQNLISDLPADFHKLNFELSHYKQKIGEGHYREQPMYNISRDGFALLAMGFTGAKALQWKLRYIEAFNTLEALAFEKAEAKGGKKAMESITKAIAYLEKGLTVFEVARIIGVQPETLRRRLMSCKLYTPKPKAVQHG